MSEDVERMFAEVLAQRFGLQGDESSAPGDPIKTVLALSLMQHFRSKPQDDGTVTIRRVAAIVGACPRCLGDDVACEVCEGAGQPGYRAPDRTALLEWIATPLHRLGLRVSARKSTTRRSQPFGGSSQ
jgi:hypothetical protein